MMSRKIKILGETSILVKRQAVFTTALLQQDLLACNTQSEPVAVEIAAGKRCTGCFKGAKWVCNTQKCKRLHLQLQQKRGALGAQALYRCKMCLRYTIDARCCACSCSTQKVQRCFLVRGVLFGWKRCFLGTTGNFGRNRCFLGAIGGFQVEKVVFKSQRWVQYRIGAR